MYSCACLFCVLCRMLAYISRFYLRDFMYRMYVGCVCGCLCVHKRFFSRRRRRLSSAFLGAAFGRRRSTSIWERLVISYSARHNNLCTTLDWSAEKTTRAGAAAFVVVVPERGGRGCAAFCLCSLSPIDHATSPPTLSLSRILIFSAAEPQ